MVEAFDLSTGVVICTICCDYPDLAWITWVSYNSPETFAIRLTKADKSTSIFSHDGRFKIENVETLLKVLLISFLKPCLLITALLR